MPNRDRFKSKNVNSNLNQITKKSSTQPSLNYNYEANETVDKKQVYHSYYSF